MSSNVYAENPAHIQVPTAYDGNLPGQQELRIDLNCKNVVYQTMVALEATPTVMFPVDNQSSGANGDGSDGNNIMYLKEPKCAGGNEFHQIDSVELWMSGRKCSEWRDAGSLKFENLQERGTSHSADKNIASAHGANAGHRQITEVKHVSENMLVINHSIEKKPLSRCSGCLSFKNVSASYIIVKFTPQYKTPTDYNLLVSHRHYQVNSIAGSDGSVNVSLSL